MAEFKPNGKIGSKRKIMIDSVIIDPISTESLNYMFNLGKETQFLDYKEIITIGKNSDFAKIMKDIFAFANSGGGFILFGISDNKEPKIGIRGNFQPVGLASDAVFDSSALEQTIESYSNTLIGVHYENFYKTIDNEERRFGLLYIEPSKEIAIPKKDGFYMLNNSIKKYEFRKGDIYIRRLTKCVKASALEIDSIKSRCAKDNYVLSVISGEPDQIEEILYGNLFKVIKFPSKIFIGNTKFSDMRSIDKELSKHIGFHARLAYLIKNEIISLQNLSDPKNLYSKLVHSKTVHSEDTSKWLTDDRKRKILVSLMNSEILGVGLRNKMLVHLKSKRLFFSSSDGARSIRWPARFRASRRRVALHVTYKQVKYVLHPAARVCFEEIDKKFYLKINSTHVLTMDGENIVSNSTTGPIITKIVYKNYNKAHLNNILFWSNQLGGGDDIHILDDFVISKEPITAKSKFGISWDIPSSELTSMIENYTPELETDVLEVVN